MSDDLAVKRFERAKDCHEVSPLDTLRTMIHDIETGVVKCDGLLVIAVNRDQKNPTYFQAYRSRLRRDEEVMILEAQKYKALKRWFE